MATPRKPFVNPAAEAAALRINASFADAFRELERYLAAELEKLRFDGDSLQHDLYNITSIRKLTAELQVKARELGMGDVIGAQARNLAALAREVLDEAAGLDMPHKFSGATAEEVRALMQDAQREIIAREVRVSSELERILVRSTVGALKRDDLLASLRSTLDINQRQAVTLAEDTIAAFHTSTRVAHFSQEDDNGRPLVNWWLYDGPLDERNRDWCSQFIGTRVTLEILDAHATDFGRKHPLQPSVSLGGYNCRHQLVPLVDGWQRYPIGPRSKSNTYGPADKMKGAT